MNSTGETTTTIPFPPDFDPDTFDWEAFAESLDPADADVSRRLRRGDPKGPDHLLEALGVTTREEAYQILLGRTPAAGGEQVEYWGPQPT